MVKKVESSGHRETPHDYSPMVRLCARDIPYRVISTAVNVNVIDKSGRGNENIVNATTVQRAEREAIQLT